jgi:Holliday junction DNA helicase RuvA
MISYLEGKILAKNEKFFVLNIGGIGYKILSHAEVLDKIPEIGQNAKIFTHLYVHEDARRYLLELYGFLNNEELKFFELLISISGIGPRSALGVLSRASVKTLKQAIVSEDEAFFTKVSGIGKKTAQKLIFELKNKLIKEVPVEKGSDSEETGEALEALVGLGYSQRDARTALRALKDIKGVEAKVKAALKFLGKK